MRRTLLTLAIVAGLVLATLSPAAAAKPPKWEINEGQVAALVAGLEQEGGSTVYSGELAGAAWVAQVPENWNGSLVTWAHGYRGEFEDRPLLTVDPPPAREFLLEQGYAWAASSYRRNSYDPGIGVIDTMKVTRHVENLLGGTEHNYLAGASMGGHVTGAAIETYRGLWDGALPVCGVMGDVELFDYFLDYNLAAAAYADVDVTYPDGDWVGDEVVEIKGALSRIPGLPWAAGGSFIAGGFSNLSDAGASFKDFVEAGSGGERDVYDAAWDYWHLAASETGDFFFDLGEGDGTIGNRSGIVGQNSDTDYGTEYGEAFASIDDDILRVSASNRARKAKGQKPAPIIEGTPDIPVLTMHTQGDLFVPIEMQQIYAEEVADNGRSDLLVQRSIRDVGHCSFTGGEFIAAYSDLFAWVRDGTRPAGEDISDLRGTAGCAFTDLSDLEAAPSGIPRGAFAAACFGG